MTEPVDRSDRFADGYAVIARNLSSPEKRQRDADVIKEFHISEFSRLVSEEIRARTSSEDTVKAIITSDEAAALFAERTSRMFPSGADGAESFMKRWHKEDRLRVCGCISGLRGRESGIREIAGYFSENPEDAADKQKEKKISFLRSYQSGKAFEAFARIVFGAVPVYGDDFQSVCAMLGRGEAMYAVIPVENTSDGRLNSFYRLMEKYELNIVLTCDIQAQDSEQSTRFALLYGKTQYIDAPGEPVMEIKITFGDITGVADVINAAEYFNVKIIRADVLPVSFAGRENAFGLVFGLKSADRDGFLCYLRLRYPQFNVVGVYTLLE